ncbi:MAG TPA: two-component regulator propeller domain-containing protein [Candidatus Eisenbacteria bacterium]|nr:two-component regulator propeller domain-containing protein [Candidatus Eisenbacteria bacterium]
MRGHARARASALLAGWLLAAPAGASTSIFITNHVHSDQVGALTVWQGRIVAATLGGLVFVDPATEARTKLLASPGGLPSNLVLAVAVGPSGILWAGTADKGVARFVPGGGFKRTLTSFDGLPSDHVQTLYVHGDSVWVGTSGGVALFTETPGGQATLRRSDSQASTAGGLVSDDILAFQQVADTMWVGTSAGLSTFANGVWINRASTLAVSVRDLALDADTLWAATQAGPRRYAAGAFTLVADGHVGGSLAFHAPGVGLLSGSSVQGVYAYTGDGWKVFSSFPPVFRPSSFVTAPDGSLWAGTDRGVARFDAPANTWTLYPTDGPAVNGVERALVDARGAWFATGNSVPAGGGLGNVLHYDGTVWSLLSTATTGGALQSASVFGLAEDPLGAIWMGHCCSEADPPPRTDRYDPDTGVWNALGSTNILVITRGPDALMYEGSVEHGNGVYVYDPTALAVVDSLTPLNTQGSALGAGLASNNLRGISFDTTGRGWIAHAATGLDIWDGRGTLTDHSDDVWKHLATGFPSVQTTAVETDGASSGWVGTVAGVVRIVNDLVVPGTTLAINSSLPSTAVRDLELDSEGNLWVATTSGLARVAAGSTFVEHWSTAEGLAGDDVRALAWDAATRTLWVGTASGISEIVVPRAGATTFTSKSYVYPSPIGPETTSLRIGGITGEVTGEVRDVTGAIVRRFRCDPAHDVVWDLLLADGTRARSGVFVVVLRDRDEHRMLRVAVVR